MVQGKDLPFVINLGNSIIGVSVLAIPFCFHRCGIVLGSVLLIISSMLTRLSCDILLRAANSAKKRTYEFLAHHTFGSVGKSLVEISTIGLLLGTCIAFHVIVGDLCPGIVATMLKVENTPTLRAIVMVALAMCVALPLSLMRNIQSLSGISAVSLGFYIIFILQIFMSSLPSLLKGALTHIHLWKFSGTFQCLPIFMMAFACQTQLFLVYDALPEPSVNVMSSIVSSAVNMVSLVYFLVGFFGYTAFCFDGVQGDVLMNFGNGLVSALVKLGFVLSIVVSFPLAIFPCRASINSLFAKQSSGLESLSGPSFIPHNRFIFITVFIMAGTLIVGILIPQVEVILALTGAIMGTLICYIVPGAMFLHIAPSGAKHRQLAKIVLIVGLLCLVASSFTIIGQLDVKKAQPAIKGVDIKVNPEIRNINGGVLNKKDNVGDVRKPVVDNKKPIPDNKQSGGQQVKDLKTELPEMLNNKQKDTRNKAKDFVKKSDDHDSNKQVVREKKDDANGAIGRVEDKTKKDTSDIADKKKETDIKAEKEGSKSEKSDESNKSSKEKVKKKMVEEKHKEPAVPVAPADDNANDHANKMIKDLEQKVQHLKDFKKAAEKKKETSKQEVSEDDNSKKDNSQINKNADKVSSKSEKDSVRGQAKEVDEKDKDKKLLSPKKDAKPIFDDKKKQKDDTNGQPKETVNAKNKRPLSPDNDKERKSNAEDVDTKQGKGSSNSDSKTSLSDKSSSKAQKDDSLPVNNQKTKADDPSIKNIPAVNKDTGIANKVDNKDSTDNDDSNGKANGEEHHLRQKEEKMKQKEKEMEGMDLQLREIELKLREKQLDDKKEDLQQKAGQLKQQLKKMQDKKSNQKDNEQKMNGRKPKPEGNK